MEAMLRHSTIASLLLAFAAVAWTGCGKSDVVERQAPTRAEVDSPLALWPPQEEFDLAPPSYDGPRVRSVCDQQMPTAERRIIRLPPCVLEAWELPDDLQLDAPKPAPTQPMVVDVPQRDDSVLPEPSSVVDVKIAAELQAPEVIEREAPERAFDIDEFDEDAEFASGTSLDEIEAYYPAENKRDDQMRSKVQEAFTLARNGALHAARGRFEELLEQIARAKDASEMTSRHSQALSAGLRALDEAEDFEVLAGTSSGDVERAAAGHQTPMLHVSDQKYTMPHEAVAMYHRYAERKLSLAVEGERAGSMVLFGLGKIYSQFAARQDVVAQAKNKSLTYYRASLLARGDNHLAANEAGVLLAHAGRYRLARPLLEHAARLGNLATTHHNLAHVCVKMGDIQQGQIHQSIAQNLSTHEKARGQLSAEHGIAWVSPAEFNRRSGAGTAPAVASRPAPPVPNNPTAPPAAPKPKAPAPSTPRTFWW